MSDSKCYWLVCVSRTSIGTGYALFTGLRSGTKKGCGTARAENGTPPSLYINIDRTILVGGILWARIPSLSCFAGPSSFLLFRHVLEGNHSLSIASALTFTPDSAILTHKSSGIIRTAFYSSSCTMMKFASWQETSYVYYYWDAHGMLALNVGSDFFRRGILREESC